MKLGSKILGLAVGQKSILVAEVSQRGERHVVQACGEFVFPEGLSLSQPEKLGTALRDFLRSKGFTTKETVIGLPAKRLVTRRKEIPAASPAIAASTLRLQAEGEFSSELDNLIMDFAGTPNAAEPTSVLLIATKKVLVDECTLMAETAGLRVKAVTSTTVALGRATSRIPGGDGLVLDLGSNGAELVIQHGADPAHVRHLNLAGGADSLGLLAGEIRRTMASIPRNGTPQTLALWNTGFSQDAQSILEQRLAIPVTTPGLEKLVSAEQGDAAACVPAIAVALTAMEATGPAVDFLHSRLAPPKAPAMSQKKKLTYAGAILLAGIVFFIYKDLGSREEKLQSLQRKNSNSANVAAVATAKADVRRYEDAHNWYPKGPHFVAVLTDLTAIFNKVLPNTSNNNSVWVTELNNVESNINLWEFKASATNDGLPDRIRNELLLNSSQAGPQRRFADVSMGSVKMEKADARSDAIYTFTITFTYVPAGSATASAPATGRGTTARGAASRAGAPASASAPASQPATRGN